MGWMGKKITYQYSVKEHTRPIDRSSGSHGTPGIYFKYDISALKVEVTKDREGFLLLPLLGRLAHLLRGLIVHPCGQLQDGVDVPLILGSVSTLDQLGPPPLPHEAGSHAPPGLPSRPSGLPWGLNTRPEMLQRRVRARVERKEAVVASPNDHNSMLSLFSFF